MSTLNRSSKAKYIQYRRQIRTRQAGGEDRPAADPREAVVFPDAWVTAGLSVRFRRGGERFRPAGATHDRALKKLLQEAGIVPWMR